METIEALVKRCTTRSFRKDPVSKQVIEEIVNAARLAPTAFNVQPWEFVVVTEQALRTRIAETTGHAPFIADAPVCIAVLCKGSAEFFLEDGCAATENILIAAAGADLGTCWVAGEKQDYAPTIVEMLGAPEEYCLISLIPIGFVGEAAEREPKRPLGDVLHWERF